MNDGWVHPLAKTLPSFVSNLIRNIVMDDWCWDENLFDKWQSSQHREYVIPKKVYKEWQIMLGYHLVFVILRCGLQLVLGKTIRIGHPKYHI
jgi:hypothetical protein